MMRRIRKLMQHEGGFTLIELLIVIVILGILAAIVVFSVLGITSRGVLAACKADLKSVQVASEAYFSQNGSYVATGAAGQTALTSTFLHSWPSSSSYSIAIATGGGTTVNTFTVTNLSSSASATDTCDGIGLK